MVSRYDYTLDGKPYAAYLGRGMLFGQVSETPATPFAVKRGQGPSTLADSLTLSYFGMDSFHGGRGQDKARSPFAFMDSKNLISFIRDRAIPGPKPYTFLAGTGVMHKLGNVYTMFTVDNGYAESFVCPAGGLSITALRFRIRKELETYPAPTVYFRLRADSAGLPGAELASAAISWSSIGYSWKWVSGGFSTYAAAGGTTYWACIESTDWTSAVAVALDPDKGYSGDFAKKNGSWAVDTDYDLYFKVNKGIQVDRTPTNAIEFYGSEAIHDRQTKNGTLSYEGVDEHFQDDQQDFTPWETTSGSADYFIRVHNDDGTISWGFLGAKVSNIKIKVYTDRALTTIGWKGDDPTGKTPSGYTVKNTTMIPPTLFFAIGKGVYYTDETAQRGYATAGGADFLKDVKAEFGVDTYNTGYTVYLVRGKGVGQSRDITDTSEYKLTVSPDWDEEPDNTTLYIVRKDSPDLQNSKTDFDKQITDMVVFKDKLYVAQGWLGFGDMWSFDGLTTTDRWERIKGERAEDLYVHVNADGDIALWRSRGHEIDCSTDGENFGTVIEVGDEQYPVTGMIEYSGEFIIFKEDGWYLVDLEAWNAEKIGDFGAQPERDAFKAHCEYAGELYAGKGLGAWRYTPGPDLTPVGPDRGAIAAEAWEWPARPLLDSEVVESGRQRTGWGLPDARLGRISSLVAVINFMYATIDAGNEDDRYSSILVYNRVGWHEVIRADAVNKPIRMLHFSPEISPTPRLWWSEGRAIKYAKIPDLSDNPYLWALAEYIEEAELETSRFDAERPVHRKALIEVGVQSQDLEAGKREIDVYYEADRSGLWVPWGTITQSPYEKLYMAVSDIGANKTVASGSTTTVIKVDSTTGIIIGEWVRIGNEHGQVLTVDSGTQFTVTLPFSSAPASGAIVYGGWPVVHDVALKFRGTTDDSTEKWALCGFAGGWVPRPPREWTRSILVDVSDDAVEGRSARETWADLMALADRPDPIKYKDYWGVEYDVFVLEPQLAPLKMDVNAIDQQVSRAYAIVRMIDVRLS